MTPPRRAPGRRCWRPACPGPARLVTATDAGAPAPGVDRPSRWELRTCGRKGHQTDAPHESELAQRLSGQTGVGQVWRCLRCGDFMLGAPHGAGPADQAPLVLRGKALRSAIILRVLAAERLARTVLLALAVYGVLRFRASRGSIQAALDRDLPALRAAGIHLDQPALVHELQHALTTQPSRLTLVAALLAGYAAVEAVGLWLLARWGEYFAAVATAVFLPLEIRELAKGVTLTRAGAFTINVAAVLYLLLAKHLFGLRGGRPAGLRQRTPRRTTPGSRTQRPGQRPATPRRRPGTGRQHRRLGARHDHNPARPDPPLDAEPPMSSHTAGSPTPG